MAQWVYTIHLKDVWGLDTAFEEKRDVIVKRLRESKWFAENQGSFIHEIADNLEEAEDVNEFDEWWNQLYDYADSHRAWIATF